MEQQGQSSLPPSTYLVFPANPSAPRRQDMSAAPSYDPSANPPAAVPHAQVQATAYLALPHYPPGPSTVQFEVPLQMQGHDYFEDEFLQQILVGAAEEFLVQQEKCEAVDSEDGQGDTEQLHFSLEDHPNHPLITFPQGPLTVGVGSIIQPLPVIGPNFSSAPATQTVSQALRLKLSSMTQGAPPLPIFAQDTISSRRVVYRTVQALRTFPSQPSNIPPMPVIAQDVPIITVGDSNEDLFASQVDSASPAHPSA